jgi:putative transposase
MTTCCASCHSLLINNIPEVLWYGVYRQEGVACIGAVGTKPAFIAPGSLWGNGYYESFNARFRDELLNGEVFTTLREAQNLIGRWRRHYDTVTLNSASGCRAPAPKSNVPIDQRPTMH